MKAILLYVVMALGIFTSCSFQGTQLDAMKNTTPMSNASERALEAMRNSDIHWQANFIGLAPTISNPATFALIACREAIDERLQQCLGDTARYAVAHVILSQRHPSTMNVTGDVWNGLHVAIQASGHVIYDPHRDLVALQQLWEKGLGSLQR